MSSSQAITQPISEQAVKPVPSLQAEGGGEAPAGPKAKKKICCACPETKALRDECVIEKGEAACAKLIEAHKQCLRAEGFNV